MGNFIDFSVLDSPVLPDLIFLTKWTSSEIAKFFKAYITNQDSSSFYIKFNIFKMISKGTLISGKEKLLFTYFNPTPASEKLNIMNLIACIIAYSSCAWKVKVKLSFLVFDFDESKNISREEMIIMIISFIRGISYLTGSSLYTSLDLEPLGHHCYELANSSPNGVITIESLTNWVFSSEDVLSFLRKNEGERVTVLNTSEKRQKMPNIAKTYRGTHDSLSVSFTGRAKRIIKRKSSGITEEKDFSSKEKDMQELHHIFFKHANEGYACVGNIYQALMESRRFKKEAEFLFHEFGFITDAKINFHQLTEYIEKVRSREGYFMKVGKKIVFPTSRQKIRQIFATDTGVLRKMFQNFDKNKDGYLNMEELKEGVGEYVSKQAISEIFEYYDNDKNRLIDFNEFVSIFSPNKKLMSQLSVKKKKNAYSC